MGRHGGIASASPLVGLRDRSRWLITPWVLAALSIEVALAIADAAIPGGATLTSAYLVPVLGLAVVETGGRTAAIGAVATVFALASGGWDGYFLTATHLYRLAVVVGGSGLAAMGATFRHRATAARDQMAMLARIGEIADGTDELQTALERLADVLVPAAADACTVALIEGGQARRVVLRVREGEAEIARSLEELSAPPPEAVEAALSGEARLIRRHGRTRGHAASGDAIAIMRRTGLSSAIFTPLRAADETLALLTLGVGPSGRTFGPDDLRFARTVGSRAALAIQNARLLSRLRASRQRLEAVVGSLADAVTIREISGRLIYANDAAMQSMGLPATDDIGDRDPAALFGEFVVTDEAGQPLSMDDLPSVRLLSGEDPEPLVLRFVDPGRGEEQWRLLKATPLYDEKGQLEAAVTIIEDITETKRAEMRSSFLSRAGEILAASLDYEETLGNVAWLAVPEIADWCAVDLVDEHGVRQQVVAAHRDPAKVELAHRLREYEPPALDPEQGLGRVLRTGEPLLYAEIPVELVDAAARSDEHRRLLRALRMRSAIVVPLHGADRILGAMTLVNAESGRTFTSDDVGFAQQIAARAAVAVENARIYSERTRIAATLQHSLLPEALPAIDGWEMASLYRPASPGGMVEVGGDFYDAFPAGTGWTVLIGDVAGKGVEAAAMTSLVRHGARFVSEYTANPAEILARLDQALRRQTTLSLCTALCLRIDGDGLRFASAGHPLPLLVGADGATTIGTAGSVLGAFKDADWPVQELVLRPGEVLLLYTDGVTDTVGKEDRFGERRLSRTMTDCGPLAPEELLACLDAALTRFQVGEQADDTAALALRLAGRPEPAAVTGAERASRT